MRSLLYSKRDSAARDVVSSLPMRKTSALMMSLFINRNLTPDDGGGGVRREELHHLPINSSKQWREKAKTATVAQALLKLNIVVAGGGTSWRENRRGDIST